MQDDALVHQNTTQRGRVVDTYKEICHTYVLFCPLQMMLSIISVNLSAHLSSTMLLYFRRAIRSAYSSSTATAVLLVFWYGSSS